MSKNSLSEERRQQQLFRIVPGERKTMNFHHGKQPIQLYPLGMREFYAISVLIVQILIFVCGRTRFHLMR